MSQRHQSFSPARRLTIVALFAFAAFAPTALAALAAQPGSGDEVTGWRLSLLVALILVAVPMSVELALIRRLGRRYLVPNARAGRFMPILIAAIACTSWLAASRTISARLEAETPTLKAAQPWSWLLLLLLGWLLMVLLLRVTLRRLRSVA